MSTADDLFDYSRGREATSAAARASIDAPTVRGLVLDTVRAAGTYGATTEEIAAKLNIGYPMVQPRTSELRHQGRIKDSGTRRFNRSGRTVIVWVLS